MPTKMKFSCAVTVAFSSADGFSAIKSLRSGSRENKIILLIKIYIY